MPARWAAVTSSGTAGVDSPIGQLGESMSGKAVVCAGPRAAEAALLCEISAWVERTRSDPALLARPLRVVVPSSSLRDHVARLMVRELGGAVAGVALQTLSGLAHEVLDRFGERARGGDALFSLIVGRAARSEPALRSALDSLDGGYAVVEAAVADLLDAGFDPSHASAVDELLQERLASNEPLSAVRAVVRTAGRTLALLEEESLGHRSLLLRRACSLLEQDAVRALPSGGVLVHGFADATGTASDLLAALVSRCGATVVLDDPASGAEDGGSAAAFTERLRERLSGLVPLEASSQASPEASVVGIAAPGALAEVRAVATRVAGLIESGVEPESIAVVARDPSAFASPLRVQLGRLGVAYSGAGLAGPPGRVARRARALCALLRSGARASLDDWFEALGDGAALGNGESRSKHLADLSLASRVLGLREVGELSAHSVARESVELPVRTGLLPPDERHPNAYARRARLSNEALVDGVKRAGLFCRALRNAPEAAGLPEHVDSLRRILAGALGWAHVAADREQSCETQILDSIERIAADASSSFGLSRDEFVAVLERSLARIEEEPVGGAGGGVQILSVMEARSRTFDALFVLGLNRDVFPRPVREDPLLPDSVRRALCELLPELAVKRRGYDEERYLFGQLLGASPEVTLSWQYTSDEGRERAPSTLIERLRWARPDFEVARAPALHAHSEHPEAARPSFERALDAALHGSAKEGRAALRIALLERERVLGGSLVTPDALAAGRLLVQAEFDRAPRTDPPLGPYLGFIGPVREAADLRTRATHVTTLESVASCGWRTLVEKWLGVEPAPDPGAELPDVDPLSLGSVVHEVLERIVNSARPAGEEGRASTAESPFPVPWPSQSRFEAILEAVAVGVLGKQGVVSPALVGLLADAARPLLEWARELDWAEVDEARGVLGAECEGVTVLPASEGEPERSLHFRADRADLLPDGRIRFTDYKTGGVFSDRKKSSTRRKHLLADVTTGRRLQAAAYAFAVQDGGEGRYLQLGSEDAEAARDAVVSRDDEEFGAAFRGTAGALMRAIELGSLAPRLAEARPNMSPCGFCKVRAACLSGDSGARQRLLVWQDSERSGESPNEIALRELTRLRLGQPVGPGQGAP